MPSAGRGPSGSSQQPHKNGSKWSWETLTLTCSQIFDIVIFLLSNCLLREHLRTHLDASSVAIRTCPAHNNHTTSTLQQVSDMVAFGDSKVAGVNLLEGPAARLNMPHWPQNVPAPPVPWSRSSSAPTHPNHPNRWHNRHQPPMNTNTQRPNWMARTTFRVKNTNQPWFCSAAAGFSGDSVPLYTTRSSEPSSVPVRPRRTAPSGQSSDSSNSQKRGSSGA